jgi:retron-type reverse transcriptase
MSVKRQKEISLYDRARNPARIWTAWEVVNRNARRSQATKTRQEAESFQLKLRLNIEKIVRSLREKTFRFKPQRAVAIPKSDGKKRPLIVAPIDNRIVQRSLLDTLQEIPSISAKLKAGYNFGGIDEKGVPDAVEKVARHSESHPYFVRTDIGGFFQHVRRQQALDVLLEGVSDQDFRALVEAAATTELDDASQHLAESGIFPLHEEGVQQGSCLSPLLCNVLLHPFDVQMNGRNVVTIRYIDDFILLATSDRAAKAAFASAKQWLAAQGLSCYDPYNPAHAKKAEQGSLKHGATFLGCDISSQGTRPSRDNFQSLKKKVSEALDSSLTALKNPLKAQQQKLSFAETLLWVSQTVRGWGNTFAFCSDERLFASIDRDIDQMLSVYELKFLQMRSRMKPPNPRRAIGVFPLSDRKKHAPKV